MTRSAVVKPLSILEAARRNPVGLRFQELVKLILAVGYKFARQKGSHAIYKRPGCKTLNIQPVQGMAKDYQVLEVIAIIEKHKLEENL